MFWLIYIVMNIQNVFCGSNAGIKLTAPVVSVIFLYSTPTYTSVRRRLKSFTPCSFVW